MMPLSPFRTTNFTSACTTTAVTHRVSAWLQRVGNAALREWCLDHLNMELDVIDMYVFECGSSPSLSFIHLFTHSNSLSHSLSFSPSLPNHRQLDNVWLIPADVLRSNVKFATNCVRQDTCAVPIFVTLYASDCPGDIGPIEMPGKLSVTHQELLGEESMYFV